MIGGPPIADMAATLISHGIDLTDDRAVIMCLMAAHYNAAFIGPNLDRVIELARFEENLNAVFAIMGTNHAA